MFNHINVILRQDVPIYATDDDVFELNRDVRYSLNGTDTDLFRIDPFDAMIWVKNQGSIDREKMESIIIEVRGHSHRAEAEKNYNHQRKFSLSLPLSLSVNGP